MGGQHQLWDKWKRLAGHGTPLVDIVADCTDETLLELLASVSGGTSEAREVVATELAYRMGVLREIAQFHAERTLLMSNRGTDASLLATAETEIAQDIVTASRLLLDNRRAERAMSAPASSPISQTSRTQ